MRNAAKVVLGTIGTMSMCVTAMLVSMQPVVKAQVVLTGKKVWYGGLPACDCIVERNECSCVLPGGS